MRLFGLIGYPLSHSFSQKYFTQKFEQQGWRDCRYELFPVQSIDEIKKIIADHPELKGLNITIPYKQPALAYLDSSENIPVGLHACNCIHIKNNKLIGYNTDAPAFEKSFSPLLKPHHQKALLLGNGGAKEAVAFVLKKRRIDFHVVSRNLHHDSTLRYTDITEEIMKEHTVIINTTPLGMYPDIAGYPPIPYPFITPRHLLFDLVYNPAKTLFLQKGEEKGATIKNGEEMLILQAEESWRIWNT